jgi:hypothetical protein
MNINVAIQTIRDNRKYFSVSAIAKEIGYDVSNLHKVIDGKHNLPERYHQLVINIFNQIFGSIEK